MRIFYEKDETVYRMQLASMIMVFTWINLVQQQRKYTTLKPITAQLLLPTYFFTSLVIYGGYSAADLHIYPEIGLPKALSFDLHFLLTFQAADSLNLFFYLF